MISKIIFQTKANLNCLSVINAGLLASPKNTCFEKFFSLSRAVFQNTFQSFKEIEQLPSIASFFGNCPPCDTLHQCFHRVLFLFTSRYAYIVSRIIEWRFSDYIRQMLPSKQHHTFTELYIEDVFTNINQVWLLWLLIVCLTFSLSNNHFSQKVQSRPSAEHFPLRNAL